MYPYHTGRVVYHHSNGTPPRPSREGSLTNPEKSVRVVDGGEVLLFPRSTSRQSHSRWSFSKRHHKPNFTRVSLFWTKLGVSVRSQPLPSGVKIPLRRLRARHSDTDPGSPRGVYLWSGSPSGPHLSRHRWTGVTPKELPSSSLKEDGRRSGVDSGTLPGPRRTATTRNTGVLFRPSRGPVSPTGTRTQDEGG